MAANLVFAFLALSIYVTAGAELSYDDSRYMRVTDSQEWRSLSNFTFTTYESIEFEYNIVFPENYAPMYLLFYTEEQFRDARNMPTCEQKVGVLQQGPSAMQGQVQYLFPNNQQCRPWQDRTITDNPYYCYDTVRFSESNQRMWYTVVARCGDFINRPGVDLKYYIRKPTEYKPTMPFYPSGSAEVSYSAFTLTSLFLLKQCLA